MTRARAMIRHIVSRPTESAGNEIATKKGGPMTAVRAEEITGLSDTTIGDYKSKSERQNENFIERRKGLEEYLTADDHRGAETS
jgi:hypothetical protein